MASTPEALYEAVRKRFTSLVQSDKMASDLLRVIRSGKASFEQAENYAGRIGELLAKSFEEEITAEKLPGGQITEEIAEALLRPLLRQDHELVTEAAAETMEALNRTAGLRMKAVRPAVETDRIDGLIDKITSYETWEQAQWVTQEPVISFSQHVADRLIEENVNSHYKAGLSPKIERKAVGGCCKWCSMLAGTYDYPVSREIYRRHRDCRCLVLYNPGNGKVQNAHTKREYDSIRSAEQEAKIEARKKKLEKWAQNEAKYQAARKEILRRVKSGEYSLKLKRQKYLQHVQGTPQFQNSSAGRKRHQSYLTVSEKEAQEIIFRYTGLGDPDLSTDNKIENREFFSFGKVIGYYYDGTDYQPTDRIAICHAKDGSHIYPVRPLEVKL